MLKLIILIVIIYLICAIPVLIHNYLVEKKETTFHGKKRNKLLTDYEYQFYLKLRKITDKHNLIIFSKVRVADVIETKDYSSFNKVKAKHIDFIICKPNTEFVKFIELDDYSHNRKTTQKRDENKDRIFKELNMELIRIKHNEIEKKLQEIDISLNECI